MMHPTPLFNKKWVTSKGDICRMDGSIVLHFDENDEMGNPDDTLARRMKNRERQRRYRARKRHEADMRKGIIVSPSTPLHFQPAPTDFPSTPMQVEIPVQVESSVNASSPDCPTRVYSQRDWKKDARSAHVNKKRHIESNIEIQAPSLPPELQDEPSDSNGPVPDSNGAHKLTSIRRHWKAEARSKKSSE